MADNENKVIDWDDEITDDGEYSGEESVILPEGNYPFEVIKTEQAWFDGSSKIPPCNMAKVFLRVDGGELGEIEYENFNAAGAKVVENAHENAVPGTVLSLDDGILVACGDGSALRRRTWPVQGICG